MAYDNVKYVAFYISAYSDTSFWTIFAFPLKIFNLTDSNELNINSYYQNNTIPKNTCFYIRVIPSLIEAKIQFKVPHNSENNFNLKVDRVCEIQSDEKIKKRNYYNIKPNLFKVELNETYDNYIYDMKTSSLNPYILIYAEILNTMDYLSISIYKQESDEQKESEKEKEKESEEQKESEKQKESDKQKESEKQKESDEQESQKKEQPDNSKALDNDSNSPVLIIIIVILSCIILIGVAYYLFKRFKKKSKSNKIEKNYKTPENDTPEPILTLLDKYN